MNQDNPFVKENLAISWKSLSCKGMQEVYELAMRKKTGVNFDLHPAYDAFLSEYKDQWGPAKTRVMEAALYWFAERLSVSEQREAIKEAQVWARERAAATADPSVGKVLAPIHDEVQKSKRRGRGAAG